MTEITKGDNFQVLNPIELDGTETDEVSVIVTEPKQQTICILKGANKKANAELITEAFNVTNETGFSPRQLADQKEKLFNCVSHIEMLIQNEQPIDAETVKMISEAIESATK